MSALRHLKWAVPLAIVLLVVWFAATATLRYFHTRSILRDGPQDGVIVVQGPLWPEWLWKPLGDEWTRPIPPITSVGVQVKSSREHDDWPERIGSISTMTRLDAGQGAFDNDEMVRLIEAGPASLASLSLTYSDVGDQVLASLEQLENLKHLSLSGTVVTKQGIERLSAARPDLKIFADKMTRYGLGKLTRQARIDFDETRKHIVGLNLRHNATTADAAGLGVLPGLLCVRIAPTRFDLVDVLAQLPNVRRIVISANNLTPVPEDFDRLPNSTSIPELTLRSAHLRDEHLPELVPIALLRPVELIGTQVTLEGLEQLRVQHPDVEVSPNPEGVVLKTRGTLQRPTDRKKEDDNWKR